MKKLNLTRSIAVKLFGFVLLGTVLFIIHSCKKDLRNPQQDETITDPDVKIAQEWYNSNYPVLATSNITKQSVFGITSINNTDLSQYMHPNWHSTLKYSRFNKDVIEMPLDSANKYKSRLHDGSNKGYGSAKNSKTSFLILKNGNGYDAYMMTIIADSSYLKGDYKKLTNNNYSKRDTDFSGIVIYFTPKGKYVSGYSYKNGHLVTSTTTTVDQKTTVNSIKSNLMAVCTDWYMDEYYGDVVISSTYLYSDCTLESTGPPAGGGPPPPPPPCPATNSIKQISVNQVAPPDPGDGSDPGFPEPIPITPCPVPKAGRVITDTLDQNYPCARKLILGGLNAIKAYYDFTAPFETANKPDLIWSDKDLTWNPNGGGTTMLGATMQAPSSSTGLGSLVTLNNKMLQNSSELMIASVAIHETIHAYINYNVVNESTSSQFQSGQLYGSWMNELDYFYDQNTLPANYKDHFEMMSDYFQKSMGILSTFDNHAHTDQQYAMVMLFGLNTADPNSTTDQKQRLNDLYNSVMFQYNISDSNMQAYWRSQLNAPVSERLPKNCN